MNVEQIRPPLGAIDATSTTALGGSSPLGRRRWSERYTFVLPLILVTVLSVQFILAQLLHPDPLRQPGMTNSMAGAIFANIIAALTYREFIRTPGTRRFAFIVPSYIFPALVLLGTVLGLRLSYNNYLLVAGLGVGIAMIFLFTAMQRPASGRKIYLVPGQRTAELASELSFLNAEMLRSPAELVLCSDGAVVADLSQDVPSEWERGIAHAVINGVPVYNAKQVRESITGKVQIETLSENSFGALVPSLSYLLLKRAIDFVCSLVGLLILAIPMMAISLAITMTSTGPAFYRHRRVGYRGREFETFKFRTMLWRSQDDDDLESQKTQANDSRITPIGQFLRRTRLDELPQLINVLRGEMSLIGPRPEALALSRWYDEHLDFYEYRHVVRPGITGWAQVNQGHVTELDDVYVKLQYDFYYIKNVSGWLDLLIALRTMSVMATMRGAK